MMSHWRERAAYKEQLSDLSSKPGRLLKSREIPPYFGWTFGLPPGLPGGGKTGLSPVSGVGARISGSTPEGGHSTPFDLASLSPSASFDWPTVAPCCAFMPGFVGAHSLERCGAGGAVSAMGVAGAGGACACTTPAAASKVATRRVDFICMQAKRRRRAEVPARRHYVFR